MQSEDKQKRVEALPLGKSMKLEAQYPLGSEQFTRSEPYLGSTENVEVRRVISNVNNGVIPVDFNKNDTLKSIIDKTIKFLNEMVLFNSKQMVIDELNKIK